MNLAPLIEFCDSMGHALTKKQQEQFTQYLNALYEVNEHTNLTRVPKEQAVVRHLIDSLLCVDQIQQGARCLDLGSGPGLPAFAIACWRPDLTVVAMDSTKKALRPLEMTPLSNLKPRFHRAEEPDERERYDFVTGRALAPLAVQLELSAAWCRVGGLVVPFRTSSDKGTIDSFDPHPLGLVLTETVERTLPGTDAARLFPIYHKAGKTPARYPRKWAEIKARPIGS